MIPQRAPPPSVSGVVPLEFEPYRDRRNPSWNSGFSAVKRQMGDSAPDSLGHHYQQDEVIRFAGSARRQLKPSQLASESRTCRSIVFCGVHL